MSASAVRPWGRIAVLSIVATLGVVFAHHWQTILVGAARHWTRVEGLLMSLGGLYVLLLARGVLPRHVKDPEKLAAWRQRFGGSLKILGPLVIGFGALQMAGVFEPPTAISKETVAALPVGGSLSDPKSGATLTLHRKQAGVPDATGWYPAQSKGCGFQVSLPGTFNDFTQEVPVANSLPLKMHGVGTRTAEGARFLALCVEGGKGSPADYVAGVVEASSKLESLKRKAVQVGSSAGQRLTGTTATTVSDIVVFSTGERAYQLSVEYPLSQAADMPAHCDWYFSSFRP